MAFAESTVQGDRNLTRKGMAEHTDALDGNREEADLVARRFNHDLLLDSADQESAARRWPSISRILIEHDLIDAFKPHEDRAKRLKLAVLRLGSVAVILTFVALLGSALHVWTESSSSGIEGSVAGTTVETCAVLGLLSAVLASRYGPLRRRWLMNRFMTEVLRQWHFRLLLDGTAISEFLGPGHNESLRRRRQHLSALLHDFKGTVGQKMDQLIEKGFDPLDRIREPQLPNHPDAQKQLLEAYRVLRLDHQREFAVYKLSADDKTFLGLSSHVLIQIAGFLAATTIVFALTFSLAHFFFHFTWLPLATISLTIAGVAVRAWRDGLALGEDRERYQDIRHRLELLTARWDSAGSDADRFMVAEEVEQAAFEELRSFIRAHERAQFLF
jgi:hypothetical protein